MPPAPTSPSTTEARVAFSTQNSEVAMNDGIALGTTAEKISPVLLAPIVESASRGPLSVSSIASAKKRPA